jgi:hypothetical protein
VALAYLQRLSGYSRAQVTRLVSRWMGFVRKGEDLPAGDATMHFLRKRVCRMNSTG